MRYKIDPDAAEHPYVQLADQLRAGITAGKIGPRMPSLLELTEATGLAQNTVRRSIAILVAEGVAYTVPGRGTFVRR